MAVTIGKLLKIGTSGPIDAGGNGPQRATRATDTGFGRGDAICECIEIMQILPGSSDNALLINASEAFCNMQAPRSCNKTSVSFHGMSGTSRFLNSRRSNHKLNNAWSVVVAIDKYQACSIRKPGIADNQISGSA
jgi:hypothetical protein